MPDNPNPTGIRFTAEELGWLKEYGERSGQAVNAIVRQAVADYRRKIEVRERRAQQNGAS
jgi:hypothetical protein